MGFMDLDSASLAPGEEIVWQGNPSWRAAPGALLKVAAIGAGVFVVLALLEAIGVDVNWAWWTVVAVLLLVAVVGSALFLRNRLLFVLTDRQVIIRRGLIGRSVRATSLDRIQNTTMRQTITARLMRVGTVEFVTAASTGGELRFVGVERPVEVERLAREVITARQAPAPASPAVEPPVEPVEPAAPPAP